MGYIVSTPGLHFRELQRRVRLETGLLQHHLGVLLKIGALKKHRQGRHLRFFPVWFNDEDLNVTGLLMHKATQRIALYLLSNPEVSLKEIARHLGTSISTARWHIEKMEITGVVGRSDGPTEWRFHLICPEHVHDLKERLRLGLSEGLAGRFVDLWDL